MTTKIITITIFLILNFNSAWAQGNEGAFTSPLESYEPLRLPKIDVIPIKDSLTGNQYDLYIKLPEDYSQSDDKLHQVIYYTDALWHVEILSGSSEYIVEDAILVGISWQTDLADSIIKELGEHASRYRDYTIKPSADSIKQLKYQFGQADKHLRFIQEDVITYVEANYKTDSSNKTYFGYSTGGLFGAYILSVLPNTFKNYIIGSPSFWWDVPKLIDYNNNLDKEKNYQINVIISNGTEETQLGQHVQEFVEVLERDSRLSVDYELIQGSHQTAFPRTAVRSMGWLSERNVDTIAKAYKIVYSSNQSGDGELYLTGLEGNSKLRITNRPGNDGYVEWSPDGKRLACYAYHDGRKTWSIHTMNADGSNRRRLTHAKNKWDSSPRWSPDGTKIVFSRGGKGTNGQWNEEIWIMNSDGSNQQQVVGIDGGGPCFTPNGNLVFHSKTETSEICMANQDGSDLMKLTDNDYEDWHPEVSPDGQTIAFISNRDGNQEIYVMAIDGSNPQRLTFNEVDDWYPSWSPDGTQLIFSSNEKDYASVYMINKDGSGLKKIIEKGNNPSWLKIKPSTALKSL